MNWRGRIARLIGPTRAMLARRNATLIEQRDNARAELARLRDQVRTLRKRVARMDAGVEAHRGEIDDWAMVEPGGAPSAREGVTAPFRNAPALATVAPPADVAFLTVANDRFVPGLEAMLRSMLQVYPGLVSDIHVMHDGTIGHFVQRRLTRVYPRLRFTAPDMAWLETVPAASPNHRRIGRLGYMNVHGLALEGYARVILIDADLLFLADFSELWTGEEAIACLDVGERAHAAMSPHTGRLVLNSGVISLPTALLGRDAFDDMVALIRRTAAEPVCEALDRFADQKAWNLWLADKPLRIAPTNYNCNAKYAVKYLDAATEMLSVIHFTGPKPWNDPAWLDPALCWEDESQSVRFPSLWMERARRQRAAGRLAEYRAATAAQRVMPVRGENQRGGRRTCVVIGDDAPLAPEALAQFRDLERFVLAPFLLRGDFDEIAPEHVVFADHACFGGWNTQVPAFPPETLAALRAKRHRPALWAPFYFRELFESEGLDEEFEINWLLFERPFVRNVDAIGQYDPDLDRFLDDARADVLTGALPAALSLGFEVVLLAGLEPSACAPGGRGERAYRLAEEAVAARGGRLELVGSALPQQV
jgi:lipopolysaccharide biosynthesis glycosyltransferase